MKKTSIAILFTILITASCLFASCNEYRADKSEESDSYAATIRELEDQILQLKRDQFISNSERDEQILKLEGMINKLQGSAPSESESENESEKQKKT